MTTQTVQSPRLRIPIDRDRLARVCREYGIGSLGVFGSALRDDFGPDSDVDVLIDDAGCKRLGFGKRLQMEDELCDVFGGHRVDLGSRDLLTEPIKTRALQEAEQYYPGYHPSRIAPMAPSRAERDKMRLEHMLEECDFVLGDVAEVSREECGSDARQSRALRHSFTILGEAAAQISGTLQNRHPDVEWGKIRGLRNVIVHAYADVDHEILWWPETLRSVHPL